MRTMLLYELGGHLLQGLAPADDQLLLVVLGDVYIDDQVLLGACVGGSGW